MSDELKDISLKQRQLRDVTARAQRAHEILNDEIFTEAFDAIKAYLTERWQKSEAREGDVREEMFRRLQSLEQVRQAMNKHIENGQLANKEIEALEVRRKFLMSRAVGW